MEFRPGSEGGGRVVLPVRGGKRRAGRRRGLLRPDRGADARGPGLRAGRFHGKAFGFGVIGDVVAANIVPAVATQPGAVGEFDAIEFVVVFDLQSFPVDVISAPLSFVAEGPLIARRGPIVEAVAVLSSDDSGFQKYKRALPQPARSLH